MFSCYDDNDDDDDDYTQITATDAVCFSCRCKILISFEVSLGVPGKRTGQPNDTGFPKAWFTRTTEA